MPLPEAPIDPDTQSPAEFPGTPQPPQVPHQPARIHAGRYGELDHHELVHLLDSIEDERARGRFRESIYISLFFWVAVAWFLFYGPRVLWHQPRLRNPSEVLRDRELTQLTMPNLPKMTAPAPRPAPKPTLDDRTMEKLREMTRRSEAAAKVPAPANQPAPPAPAPSQPMTSTPATPPPPPAPTPTVRQAPPVVADAPTPQPTRPNFGQPPSAGNAIQDAISAAARSRRGGGLDTGGGSYRRSGPLNLGGAEVLSDTQGVDFNPYLRRILGDIRRNWEPLIPPEAQSPLFKQGEAYIRFTINPDGSIGAMHLDGSTHDEAINRSCWGSITSEGQFPPLPPQFHGPNLELRIHYLVNKGQAE